MGLSNHQWRTNISPEPVGLVQGGAIMVIIIILEQLEDGNDLILCLGNEREESMKHKCLRPLVSMVDCHASSDI